jgi:hypothetical protein
MVCDTLIFIYMFVVLFETGSHFVTQAGLKLMTLLLSWVVSVGPTLQL